MVHWVCYPSADLKRGEMCAREWKAKGYKVALYVDGVDAPAWADLVIRGGGAPFPGYYKIINRVATEVFERGATVGTFCGDDMNPDPYFTADQIAEKYLARFPDGFGVMQATGDRQGEIIDGQPNSGRICGSPTFGIGWHKRAFEGSGGFPKGFRSFYADEMLKVIAEKLGVLWQNPDVCIDHAHWSFGRTKKMWWHEKAQANWDEDQRTFFAARDNGFADYLKVLPV